MRDLSACAQDIISEILEHTYITESRPPFRFTHEDMIYLVQNTNELFKDISISDRLNLDYFFLNEETYIDNPHAAFSEIENPRGFVCFLYDRNKTDYNTILAKEGYPAEYFEHGNSRDGSGFLHRDMDYFQE